MIHISLFNTLLAIAGIFCLYGLIDYENKHYINVFAVFLAGFMLMYLSGAAEAGAVYDATQCSWSVSGANTTPYDCTVKSAAIDLAMAQFIQYWAVGCWVYALVFSGIAYITWKKNQKVMP